MKACEALVYLHRGSVPCPHDAESTVYVPGIGALAACSGHARILRGVNG